MKNRDYIFFFCVGILFGSLVATLLITIQNYESSALNLLKDFQSLLAGGLAFASALSVLFYYQKRDSNDFQISKKASISTLPIFLTEVSFYAKKSARIASQYGNIIDNNSFKQANLEIEKFPRLRSEVIQALSTATLYIDTQQSDQLLDILSCYQIHQARFEDLEDSIKRFYEEQYLIPTVIEANDLAIGAAHIGLQSDKLYSYLRKNRNTKWHENKTEAVSWLEFENIDLIETDDTTRLN